MKEKAKLATEYDPKKEECTLGRHGWLWLSISFLVLGQVASFVYLFQAQQNLVDSYSSNRFKCSCPTTEEKSFNSSPNSSVSEGNFSAPRHKFVENDFTPQNHLARSKRNIDTTGNSGKSKHHRHSNKVNLYKAYLYNIQQYYSISVKACDYTVIQ